MLEENWVTMDGEALAAGFDPLSLPIDRLLNWTHYWATRDGDEQGIAKFEMRLWRPPLGVAPSPQSPWAPANETAALSALGAALRGSPTPAAVDTR
jgi:hypothetical protein